MSPIVPTMSPSLSMAAAMLHFPSGVSSCCQALPTNVAATRPFSDVTKPHDVVLPRPSPVGFPSLGFASVEREPSAPITNRFPSPSMPSTRPARRSRGIARCRRPEPRREPKARRRIPHPDVRRHPKPPRRRRRPRRRAPASTLQPTLASASAGRRTNAVSRHRRHERPTNLPMHVGNTSGRYQTRSCRRLETFDRSVIAVNYFCRPTTTILADAARGGCRPRRPREGWERRVNRRALVIISPWPSWTCPYLLPCRSGLVGAEAGTGELQDDRVVNESVDGCRRRSWDF